MINGTYRVVLFFNLVEQGQIKTLRVLAVVVVLFDEGLLSDKGRLDLLLLAIEDESCLVLSLLDLHNF